MDAEIHNVSQRDLGSSSSSEFAYVPQVVFEKIPKIGQEFESIEEYQNYYNDYARDAGFSVRNYSTKKNNFNEIIRKEFVCVKEGIRDERSKANCSRKRGLTREGCKAKMTIVKKGAVFVVKQFNEIHNHILTTPRKVHMLRSHRSMSNTKKALTQQFDAATFNRNQLQQPLSSVYILPRWTKAAKSFSTFRHGGDGGINSCEDSLVVHHITLHKLASNIIDDALMSRETCMLAKETFESLHNQIKSMTLSNEKHSTPSIGLSEPVYKEPDKVRAKGCGKRLKGGKEMAMTKNRHCHDCGLTGHDKRNCPTLNNATSHSQTLGETLP
ncbi:uncharacterized protein LOC119987949 [Tripterygium wilfordii]|uniref:uncharacterized protein LOC119987949 n=1 Tax=Tripterygium wilfordii TaxID=458696 RepID=UPI0018F7E6C6|nr:uncharacterized protein LOC119987949 [Tripterygium wilfordii]